MFFSSREKKALDLNDIPPKSGCGPVSWFQTHNVDYTKIGLRQWLYIVFHYGLAFAVMFYFFTWLQELDWMTEQAELQGLKGLYAALAGIAMYYALPHRMYHFHGQIPYAEYCDVVKKLQQDQLANGVNVSYRMDTINEAMNGMKAMELLPAPGVPLWPRREKSGWMPGWFEVHNVPYFSIEPRNVLWILYHYLGAFMIMYYMFTWSQECDVMDASASLKGHKGIYAAATGILLYWLIAHRMYHPLEVEPCSTQVNHPPIRAVMFNETVGGDVEVEEDYKEEADMGQDPTPYG